MDQQEGFHDAASKRDWPVLTAIGLFFVADSLHYLENGLPSPIIALAYILSFLGLAWQPLLISTWMNLGRSSWNTRIFFGFALLVILIVAKRHVFEALENPRLLSIFAALFAVLIASPVATVAIIRFRHDQTRSQGARQLQFSIRHLVVLLTACAMLFAIVRYVLIAFETSGVRIQTSAIVTLAVVSIFAGGVISTVFAAMLAGDSADKSVTWLGSRVTLSVLAIALLATPWLGFGVGLVIIAGIGIAVVVISPALAICCHARYQIVKETDSGEVTSQ